MSVVHIGEHTLSKRLYEFSHTSASTFTAGEGCWLRSMALETVLCLTGEDEVFCMPGQTRGALPAKQAVQAEPWPAA